MKLWTKPGADEHRKRLKRIEEDVPRMPLWLKISSFAAGLFFIFLFISWAIWSMWTVVIPRFHGHQSRQPVETLCPKLSGEQ